jgi:hypothetical protein
MIKSNDQSDLKQIEGLIEHPIDPSELVRLIVMGSNDQSNLKQLKLKVQSNI